MTSANLDQLSINTLRFLAADSVEKAQSGHAGTPMGAAPIAYVLWSKFLKHSPSHPDWVDRDRFVLSSGHASIMLYSLLHLTGYSVSLDDLRQFRQWNSLTPGHPEYRHTPGVETTTGPLGQGFANAVGMAVAEAHLAARFNRPDFSIVDHFTYVLASDGDLMEGVASEAASLAGHLRLGKLVCLYDDNHVTIEGSTDLAFSEDSLARFKAYGWHIQQVDDANDLPSLMAALEAAQSVADRPSLIAIKSVIGYGSPGKQGTSAAHSGPLGAADLSLAKENLGWAGNESFHIPAEVLRGLREAVEVGKSQFAEWSRRFEQYRSHFPEMAAEFLRVTSGELPVSWDEDLPVFETGSKLATRKANAPVMASLSRAVPELMGGSADLAPSNITLIPDSHDFAAGSYDGRILRFGVREHAMGALLNGLAVHGGVKPFGATFLTFSDYLRPAIRLGAMMALPVIYVFTHDSIAIGEDGPTHQPVEHIFGLRSVPNLTTIRPCDANEAVAAWKVALQNKRGPTCLVLTRQALTILDRTIFTSASELQRGAYILKDPPEASPDLILIATGSEVHLAVEAQKQLEAKGLPVRVVSMPSWELFAAQSSEYQESVLPSSVKARVAIEAGITLGWDRWVGDRGTVIGLDRFGASGPAPEVLAAFGFTVENVVRTALDLVNEALVQ